MPKVPRLALTMTAVFAIAASAWLYGAGSAASRPGDHVFAAAALGAPALIGADRWRLLIGRRDWLNGQPLREEDLRGKVVLVNFWTYTCINSLRPLPYVRAWAEKYRDRGLVVVGVHTPEFGFEQDAANVRHAVSDQGVRYPVVQDNDYAIWRAYGNSAWPAFYFIGADGRVRRQILGEGRYDEAERLIQSLLAEAGHAPVSDPIKAIPGTGSQVAPDWAHIRSEETYVGYGKADGFSGSPAVQRDRSVAYRPAGQLALDRWNLSGSWTVGAESAAAGPQGAIAYRFHARDLNLVLAPGADGHPVRFRVRLDGAEPGPDHGFDTDAQGFGRVDQPRMYQLARQSGSVRDRTFEIQFLDPGARAFVFTFG